MTRQALAPLIALLVSTVVVGGLFAGSANAQPSEEDIEEARAEFQLGNEAYIDEDWRAAIEHFETANAIAPNPILLDYIGRAYANMGRYDDAIASYEAYAETSPEAAEQIAPVIESVRAERIERSIFEAMQTVGEGFGRASGNMPTRLEFSRAELSAPAVVTVQVRSTPRGAEVFMDGYTIAPVGVTPVELEVFPGPHHFEVRVPGHATEGRVVQVSVPNRGESIPVIDFELERMQVPVSVRVTPITTAVTYVGDDGSTVDLGVGAFEGELAAGTGAFLLQQGGRDRRIAMDIGPNEDGSPVEIELYLNPEDEVVEVDLGLGTIVVETDFFDADVMVDGRVIGRTPGEIEADFRPGDHLVEVARPGYETWSRTVEVEADRETRLLIDELDRASNAGVIGPITTTVLGLGAAGAGTFLLIDGDTSTGAALAGGGAALAVGGIIWGVVRGKNRNRRAATDVEWGFAARPLNGGAFLNWTWTR